MFLHDYLLACEISTVRTQTLRLYKLYRPMNVFLYELIKNCELPIIPFKIGVAH